MAEERSLVARFESTRVAEDALERLIRAGVPERVLQLVTPAPSADPLQRKMMAIGMPVFMLYILWSAPSGLVLYWLVGNIVGFSQQFLINRWTKPDDQEVPAPPVKGTAGRKKKVDAPATG